MTNTTIAKKKIISKLPKEDISQLIFKAEDVLSDVTLVARRKIDLQRAQALGAQSKSNIKIYVADEKAEEFIVEATVWAATEKNVTLKGGVIIPNRGIYKIGFF